MELKGRIVDIAARRIFHGVVGIENGRIAFVREAPEERSVFILPGFVDAHVHIESSMVVPSEFARMAVLHGTVATVSDPHEIANVLGVDGVRYMIDNGRQAPFKFFFGAPSCVPATTFETAGAILDAEAVEALLRMPEIKYLSEMMNYPGVLNGDAAVMAKLAVAHRLGKPVDGHAPGLRGEAARRYAGAGISTDHECFSYEEALEKLEYGMKILIREGSAARNFEALIDLLPLYPGRVMFCSDDKHPDDLLEGHINRLAARAIARGFDLFDVLQAACVNPVEHYRLEVGLLRPGDPADLILVDDIERFEVATTYINGRRVAEYGQSLITSVATPIVNNFKASFRRPEEFEIVAKGEQIQVIKAIDGEIVTGRNRVTAKTSGGLAVADPGRDIMKMAVLNRYEERSPAVAFVQGFGLTHGAIASSVAHDSHNVIAIGADDESLCRAVNLVIENKGGICAVGRKGQEKVLPLPIAGIMTGISGFEVANQYADIDAWVKEELGSTLSAPFMTLSFLSLLVIPDLKLSDRGLFDGKEFKFCDLFSLT